MQHSAPHADQTVLGATGPSPMPVRSARFGDDANVLRWLADPEVDVVGFPRHQSPGLAESLADWVATSRAEFDARLDVSDLDLSGAFDGMPDGLRAAVEPEVVGLVERLARFAGRRQVHVSFGAIRTDQCRKFHVDFVRYRLVSTFLGPGTEWVPTEFVRHAGLDHPPDCPCDANRAIVPDPTRIRHARAGDVLVMKGARHPDGRGLIHRSPSIEASGAVRVLLVASLRDAS